MLAGVAGPARAQAPAREALLDTFDRLRAEVRRQGIYDPHSYIHVLVPRGPGGPGVPVEMYGGDVKRRLDLFPGVRGPGDAGRGVKMAIKVWAVPLRDGRLTEKKVHIGKYRWRPREEMAVFFETAVPVQVGFYQEFGGGEEPRRVRVLPDSKFPDSSRTVQPGYPYKFPVSIELDNNYDDEVMVIVAVASGSDSDLKPAGIGGAKVVEKHAVFGRYYAAMDRKAREAHLVSRFRASSSGQTDFGGGDPDPGSEAETMGDPDEVATLAYGENDYGMLRLVIHKRTD